MSTSTCHPYQVTHVSNASPIYKIAHIENKNPQTFWRTSGPSEYAYFEIKFSPVRIHHIEVLNTFSPQIEVEAYNKDSEDQVINRVTCVPKTTIISMNDFMGNKTDFKAKRFDFHDKPFIPNTEYSYMTVHVYNPYHEQKPAFLGLISFILYANSDNQQKSQSNTPYKLMLKQMDMEITQQLKKSIGFDKLEPSPIPGLSNKPSTPVSLFKNRTPVTETKENYGKSSTYNLKVPAGNKMEKNNMMLKRHWQALQAVESDMSGFHQQGDRLVRKKIKANWMKAEDGKKGNDEKKEEKDGKKSMTKTESEENSVSTDNDEMRKAIEESKKMFKKEKEREQERKKEEPKVQKKLEFKEKKPDIKVYKPPVEEKYDDDIENIEEEESGDGDREGEEEKTQDLDDFMKAIEESKKMFEEEEKRKKEEERIMLESLKKFEEEYGYSANKGNKKSYKKVNKVIEEKEEEQDKKEKEEKEEKENKKNKEKEEKESKKKKEKEEKESKRNKGKNNEKSKKKEKQEKEEKTEEEEEFFVKRKKEEEEEDNGYQEYIARKGKSKNVAGPWDDVEKEWADIFSLEVPTACETQSHSEAQKEGSESKKSSKDVKEKEKEENNEGEVKEENLNYEEVLTEIIEDSMNRVWDEKDEENNQGKQMEKEKEKMEVESEVEKSVKKEVKVEESEPITVVKRSKKRRYYVDDDDDDIQNEEKGLGNSMSELKVKEENEKSPSKFFYEHVLKGVVFSLSGFIGEEKNQIKDKAIYLGAKFLDDLCKGVTTHLVTNNPLLNKYRSAVNMGKITIVAKEWVERCYEEKRRLDEK